MKIDPTLFVRENNVPTLKTREAITAQRGAGRRKENALRYKILWQNRY